MTNLCRGTKNKDRHAGVSLGVWHAHVLVEICDVDCEEQLVLALGPLAVGNLGHLYGVFYEKFCRHSPTNFSEIPRGESSRRLVRALVFHLIFVRWGTVPRCNVRPGRSR